MRYYKTCVVDVTGYSLKCLMRFPIACTNDDRWYLNSCQTRSSMSGVTVIATADGIHVINDFSNEDDVVGP